MSSRGNIKYAVAQLCGQAVHACDAWQEVGGLGIGIDRDAAVDIVVEDDAVSAKPCCRAKHFGDIRVFEVQRDGRGRSGGREQGEQEC
ncbi:MAG: hypothetical protein SPL39_05295 [Selenomonadaceae bacterium]|nr:hypothetical protein [Selenomonadaceae bacterium]